MLTKATEPRKCTDEARTSKRFDGRWDRLSRHFNLLVIAAIIGGCGHSLNVGDPPPERIASTVALGPGGTVKATALVRFRKGHVSMTSGGPDELFHIVQIERNGTSKEVQLAKFTHGYLGETSDRDYAAAVRASMSLVFASDGHAISVSTNESKACYAKGAMLR